MEDVEAVRKADQAERKVEQAETIVVELQEKIKGAAILQEVIIYTKLSKCVLYEIEGHYI